MILIFLSSRSNFLPYPALPDAAQRAIFGGLQKINFVDFF